MPDSGSRTALLGLFLCIATASACSVDKEPANIPIDDTTPQEPAKELPVTIEHLEVPVDYADPLGPKMQIEYGLQKRGSGKRTALLVLAGGPGGNALDLRTVVHQQLQPLEDRDVVFFNIRGVGSNVTRIACLGDYQSRETPTELDIDKFSRCIDEANQRIPIYTISSANFARDVETLRTTLGYANLTVYSESYGTVVALELMRLFPETVHAAVLDSSLPHNVPFLTANGSQLEESMLALFEQCEQDASCGPVMLPPGVSFSDLLRDLVGFADSGKWYVEVTDEAENVETVPVDFYTFRAVLSFLLRQWDMRMSVLRILAESAAGDDAVLSQVLSYFAQQSNVYGLDRMVHYIVLCNEFFRFDSLTTEQRDALESSTFFGTTAYDTYHAICPEVLRLIPSYAVEVSTTPVATNTRTLLLCGADDPVTPAQWAQGIAASLPAADLACLPYQAHGVILSECGRTLAHEFLDAPDVPLDRTCVSTSPPPWDPPSTSGSSSAALTRRAFEAIRF